jgi:hypothetical protein
MAGRLREYLFPNIGTELVGSHGGAAGDKIDRPPLFTALRTGYHLSAWSRPAVFRALILTAIDDQGRTACAGLPKIRSVSRDFAGYDEIASRK